MKRDLEDPLYWNTVRVNFFNPFLQSADGQTQPVLKTKEYVFHLPRALRGGGLQPGSIVLVHSRVSANGKKKTMNVPAVIVAMYREEIELTGKRYMPVVANLYSDYRGKF